MAKRFKLKQIEEERGDLKVLIPKLLEKHDGIQKSVADELGVSQATISFWLSQNGFVRVQKWIRKDQLAS